jgi:alkylation response protein AidB-like acyl-CoA dehydrogenase
MFNLAQSAEQTDLAEALRQLGQRAIRPLMTHGGRPSPADLERVWRDLHGMGLTAPVGDDAPDVSTAVLIAEEAGFADPGVGYDLVSRYRAASMIDTLGSPEQREAYLPRLVADAGFGAGVAYFEGFGRSPRELRTLARRTGDGWELTGRKIGVTRPADLQVVAAADAESGELLAFVLEPGTAGVTVTRDDREVGKLGADAVSTANVELTSVVLPESARLAGGDDLNVHRAVAALRIGLAAVLLGTARAELAYAADYANTRVAFGQPIAQYQGVAFPLVEVDMEIDTSRLLVWKTAADIETLTDVPTIVERTADVVSRCRHTALEAGRHGINTLGGHGFISDHPLEQWHRGSATLAGLDFDPLETDCVVL